MSRSINSDSTLWSLLCPRNFVAYTQLDGTELKTMNNVYFTYNLKQ